MNKVLIWLTGVLLIVGYLMSSLSIDNSLNIKLIQKLATEAYQGNKVLADLTTAQAILESNLLGKVPSKLAFKYNNLFGIKGRGTNGSVTLETTEYIKGKGNIRVPQSFAWNATIEDSIEQRKKLFQKGTRDKPTRYFKVLAAPTFEEAAIEVHKAGYATDPEYPKKLIEIYNKYLKGK